MLLCLIAQELTQCSCAVRERPQWGEGKYLTITGPATKIQQALEAVLPVLELTGTDEVSKEDPPQWRAESSRSKATKRKRPVGWWDQPWGHTSSWGHHYYNPPNYDYSQMATSSWVAYPCYPVQGPMYQYQPQYEGPMSLGRSDSCWSSRLPTECGDNDKEEDNKYKATPEHHCEATLPKSNPEATPPKAKLQSDPDDTTEQDIHPISPFDVVSTSPPRRRWISKKTKPIIIDDDDL